MSNGLSDVNRDAAAADAVLTAADALADALLDIRDAAFGYTSLTIEIVNDSLQRAGVRLVSRGCGARMSGSRTRP